MGQSNALRACAVPALAALLASSAIRAAAQPAASPSPSPTSSAAARTPADEGDFVRELNAANAAELEQAKFVVNRTKNADVHAFAQHMIDDHSTAAVALEAATRGTDLRPPREVTPGAPGARPTAVLESESGTQLDTDYMRMQVPAHRRVLALLRWETQHGRIPSLTALASTLTPTVQQHLEIAQHYLAAHGLTPYSPPIVVPVPGNPNPNGVGANAAAGAPNNPASTTPAPRPT